MKKLNKITSTLSIATSILLQACSSATDAPSGTPAEANTKAPELNATWVSRCIITTAGSTITQPSGGSGSVSGGNAYLNIASFNANGSATLSTEYFATTTCNPNTTIKTDRYVANYYIGNASMANDGSPVTDILYSTPVSSLYSVFQIVNGSSLYLGNIDASTAGIDGSSEALRLDGLGFRLNRI